MASLHAVIHGRVQGVGFRYAACQEGLRLGLTGWVRNLYDGTVELAASGQRTLLDQLAEWLRHGPIGARVIQVDLEWSDEAPEVSSTFEIR
jgi:acylphosphatase